MADGVCESHTGDVRCHRPQEQELVTVCVHEHFVGGLICGRCLAVFLAEIANGTVKCLQCEEGPESHVCYVHLVEVRELSMARGDEG